MDRYQIIEVADNRAVGHREAGFIGKGAYGKVYKAKDKETNDFVALKKLKVKRYSKFFLAIVLNFLLVS
jgi:hypothetical protein